VKFFFSQTTENQMLGWSL